MLAVYDIADCLFSDSRFSAEFSIGHTSPLQAFSQGWSEVIWQGAEKSDISLYCVAEQLVFLLGIQIVIEGYIEIKGGILIAIEIAHGNEMLKRISQSLFNMSATHYLLVYDPYEANIDWGAIMPFLNKWGEVIINHMVSDSIRAIKMAKSQVAISKYERTYLTSIEQLIPYGSNRETYEERVEKIIHLLHRNKERSYFVSAFPFFNSKNAIVYNLIHCTNNIAGFRLYKETAWRTFGGKSSTKNTHGSENQYLLDFDNTGWGTKSYIDESCYYVKDIAEYLQRVFDGKNDVCLEDMWAALDSHPVFPSTGFRRQIKSELKRNYGAKEARGKMSFANRGIF